MQPCKYFILIQFILLATIFNILRVTERVCDYFSQFSSDQLMTTEAGLAELSNSVMRVNLEPAA